MPATKPRYPGSSGVQFCADRLRAFVSVEWLGKKVDAFFQWQVPACHLGAVAAGIDHFQSGILLQEKPGEFLAVHPAGQHEVGEEQADFTAVFIPRFQGGSARGSLEYAIAEMSKGGV